MGDADDVASVESDDMVADQEQPFVGFRRAVSSGEPSLDGSVDDDDREALSDSDLGAVARASTIAKQVKGPSSDDLEGECLAEAKARLEPSSCAHDHADEGTKKDDEWDDILGSGQLLKKKLVQGSGDKRPTDGYWVTVSLTNTLHPSESSERLSFILGFGMVIDAVELVVKLMHVGERCAVKAQSRFAYGSAGLAPTIPPDEAQQLEIELLEIGVSPRFSTMLLSELEEFLAMLREKGRFYFGREEFDKAVFVYRRATSIVDVPEGDADDDVALRRLLSTFHSNLAICYERLDDVDAMLTATTEALRLDPSNVKALYRRGLALARKNYVEDAIDYIKRALRVQPHDVVMSEELARLHIKQKKQKEQERARCRRMLTGAGTVENKNTGVLTKLLTMLRSKRSGILTAFFVLTLALFVHFLIQASIYSQPQTS